MRILSALLFISSLAACVASGDPEGLPKPSRDAGSSADDSGLIADDAATNDSGSFFFPDAASPIDTGVPEPILCKLCQSQADCMGPGPGTNFCLQDPSGGSSCGVACNTAADCTPGNDCYQITDQNNNVVGMNCYPANNGSCVQNSSDAGVGADANPNCGIDTWTNYAQAFFTNTCSCHGSLNTLNQVQLNKSRIRSTILGRSMPRGTSLSQAEIQRVISWIDCNMPQ